MQSHVPLSPCCFPWCLDRVIFCWVRRRAVRPTPTARSAFTAVAASVSDGTLHPGEAVAVAVVVVVVVEVVWWGALLFLRTELLKRIGVMVNFEAVGRARAPQPRTIVIMLIILLVYWRRLPLSASRCVRLTVIVDTLRVVVVRGGGMSLASFLSSFRTAMGDFCHFNIHPKRVV